jgi:F-type H+-transporting ATPase subunit delta
MKITKRSRKAARQLFQLCLVDRRLDDRRVRLIAKRLSESDWRGSLAILSGFLRLVRLDRDRHLAVVESAASLTDDVRETVQARLVMVYGTGLETSFRQNADLIGGMRIKVGSDVYDGSVRRKLEALEARL